MKILTGSLFVLSLLITTCLPSALGQEENPMAGGAMIEARSGLLYLSGDFTGGPRLDYSEGVYEINPETKTGKRLTRGLDTIPVKEMDDGRILMFRGDQIVYYHPETEEWIETELRFPGSGRLVLEGDRIVTHHGEFAGLHYLELADLNNGSSKPLANTFNASDYFFSVQAISTHPNRIRIAEYISGTVEIYQIDVVTGEHYHDESLPESIGDYYLFRTGALGLVTRRNGTKKSVRVVDADGSLRHWTKRLYGEIECLLDFGGFVVYAHRENWLDYKDRHWNIFRSGDSKNPEWKGSLAFDRPDPSDRTTEPVPILGCRAISPNMFLVEHGSEDSRNVELVRFDESGASSTPLPGGFHRLNKLTVLRSGKLAFLDTYSFYRREPNLVILDPESPHEQITIKMPLGEKSE